MFLGCSGLDGENDIFMGSTVPKNYFNLCLKEPDNQFLMGVGSLYTSLIILAHSHVT